MKKLISSLLVIVLLISSLFILTGCEKGEEGDTSGTPSKDVAKYYENAETGVFTDKWNGLETKFAYPKDKGFESSQKSKSAEYQKLTLTSKDLNCKLTLAYRKVAADEVSKRLTNYAKDTEKYADAAEIEYAGYKGSVVNYTDYSGTKKYILLMLTEVEEGKGSEDGWYGIDISLEKSSTSSSAAEFDAVEYYNSEEFQNLLNSIQFSKIDPVTVDGVLGSDRELVVKTLTAPNENYTVSQFPDTNGVMNAFMLTDGKYNGSGAYFRIYSMRNISDGKFKTLDDVLNYYTGSTWNYTYTDGKIVDQAVKIEHNPKAPTTSEKYAIWESGYFEKDGDVFNFLYYRYEDVPEEIGNQLITEVLNGISFYTEE